ncbi:MAG: DNA mismatch repair protein MutS [Alphaproteobacteria bacterium]|jgi:DNA mismatch repair protein MutS
MSKTPANSSSSAAAAAPPPGVTPSMAQFLEIKAANPDSLLWYRMGDFYELFFEDAVMASETLSIVLTKRGKHLGEEIPMCGVPVHRADEYLQRLIRAGHRVAVCEQLEDPAEARKRGAKAIVHRDVVRLVTPGTLTEDALLDDKARNYLTAIFREPAERGQAASYLLASVDISTGEFEIGDVGIGDIGGEIMRLMPGEIVAVDDVLAEPDVARTAELIRAALTPAPAATFDSLAGERAMLETLGVADLGAFGTFSRGELAAVGALLKYVELTQIGAKPAIRPPRKSGRGAVLMIDAASRASLELLRSSSGDRRGSLLASIDRTVTGAGSRELAGRISSPLCDVASVTRRLDAVQYLLMETLLREDTREALKRTPDIARAVSRIALQRAGPRDLAAVRDALVAGRACAALLKKYSGAIGLPDDLRMLAMALAKPSDALLESLQQALVDEPPHQRRDGGFIREGFDASLDEARALRDDSRKVMAELEAEYQALAGIKTLKVKHNNMLGFFIEVGAATAKPMLEEPLSDTFRHRQTMANAVRFSTPKLVEIEGQIASAAERATAIENEMFAKFGQSIGAEENALSELAAALADLDCLAALAELADVENYARPIVDDTLTFVIRDGRHPVVEQALARDLSGPFIRNDCVLALPSSDVREAYNQDRDPNDPVSYPPGFDQDNTGHIWLVTGPNMAGKSTFLRQNALITLMAQMGSFVPAGHAHIGIVDRLFSRVGASDDIASGRSTFMVEMVETAAILNAATERSFVILDEIGRGTSTFDGLSIAWATVEHLHDVNSCRSLFATHYHELTTLSDRLDQIANVTVDVKEWKDEIVFLHKVRAGAADRSYGIHVARLAGLPDAVTHRAKEILAILEEGKQASNNANALEDLPLFAASLAQAAEPAGSDKSPLDTAVDDINPDELTPRAALDLIYQLKRIRLDGGG